MSDVTVLRNAAARAFNVGADELGSATLAAADALEREERARSVKSLPFSLNGPRAYLLIPWQDSLTGESTKAEWSLGTAREAGLRLIRTGLAMLDCTQDQETDRD